MGSIMDLKNITFIRCTEKKCYIAERVEVTRGIRNKDKLKEHEILIYGCKRELIPEPIKSLIKPELDKFSEFNINFLYEDSAINLFNKRKGE